ncbi:MAG: YkgJ family cysteine cluster protein [Alphaproteobacteria bacterium]|nr:YkgJ family cysteine cluster protein [Alphaproteobacteria bacterium]
MTNNPRTSEDDELDEMDIEASRLAASSRDEQVEMYASFPVQPVKLTADDSFSFSCHKGVSCWNRCCQGADITLTPNCILRLSKHLGIRPTEFLLTYTLPDLHPKADLPVAKLKMGDDGRGACAFSTPDGCSVYESRPATCRYYPLGMVSMKMKDMEGKEDFFFLVKEDHCQGHCESKTQNVGQFRTEQGVEEFDRVNRGWIDILMKMASWKVMGGPGGKAPTAQLKKMFFMATTDVDSFRRFVLGTKFLESYDVAPEAVELIKASDDALLQLAFDWMKNVLFNEPTILLKEQVLQQAIAKARTDLGAS